MFGIPLGLLIRIGIALAIAAALAYAWHRFVDHYREQGRTEVRVEWDADKARRIALTAAMTTLWDEKRIEAEKAAAERDHERTQRQADALARARSLPPAVAAVAVPGIAVSVLNRAVDDSAAAAGPARTPDATAAAAPASADSTVGLLTEWGVTVIGMYETCRVRVTEWQGFYASLQAAQPKEVVP